MYVDQERSTFDGFLIIDSNKLSNKPRKGFNAYFNDSMNGSTNGSMNGSLVQRMVHWFKGTKTLGTKNKNRLKKWNWYFW